ncbi:hypothetical protein [Streptomyces sp. NPDC046197]|uniref:hypothetical protein n=1 Tax=Streptomyces sp. NPDC046197 TaxID=3154337 RepID=UPI00340AE16B
MKRSSIAALALVLASSAGLAAAPAAQALQSPAASKPGQAVIPAFKGSHPELNGLRVKGVGSPAVYLILDGRRRWIPNPATYNNLFRDWNGIQSVVDIGSIDAGSALSDGAFLGKASNAPAVYLFSNGVKRWITSPAAMDKYYFDWQKIQTLPPGAVSSIPTGAPIS